MRSLSLTVFVFLLLVSGVGFFYTVPIAVATGTEPEPTPKVKTKPYPAAPVVPKDNCDPNGGLAEKPCKGFRLTQTYSDAEVSKFTEKAPKYCTYNQNYDPAVPGTKTKDNFRCIFNSAIAACITWVTVQNEVGGLAGMPWKAVPIKIQGALEKDRMCTYCRQGQTKSLTNYDGAKYCSNDGQFGIYFENQLFGPYPDVPYFCVNVPVSGPYSNIPDDFTACGQSYTQGVAGALFTQTQKDDIKALNRSHFNLGATSNQNISDLAGFCFNAPPQGCGPTHDNLDGTCTEPDTPIPSYQMQVHHIVPRSSANSCACGTNSPKNAAVISAQLNGVFSNQDLTTLKVGCSMQGQSEEEVVNALGAYTVFNVLVYHLNRIPKYDAALLRNRPVKKMIPVPKTKKVRSTKKKSP